MCATRRVLCAVALGLLLAVPVHAQVTTADLVGRVTDTSGGVLPGATVTVTNDGTRDVRVATDGRRRRLRVQPAADRQLHGRR